MSGLREQTAAAIREHLGLENFPGLQTCGECIDADELAAAVVEALGLTEERTTYAHTEAKAVPGGQQSRYLGMRTSARWVSGWSVVGGDQ